MPPRTDRPGAAGRGNPVRGEESFQALFESAPDAMVIVDSAGRIVLVNAQTETVFGYPRQELLGRPVEVLIPDRYRDRHRRHRSDYGADPRVRPMGDQQALYGVRKDGTEVPVEICLSPLQTSGETLVSCAIRDVSERKRIEAALRERETQLRNLADNIPDGVLYQVVRRPDGSNYFPYMSEGLTRVFGLRPDEPLGDPDAVYRLLHPEDAHRLRAAADESVRTGTPFDVECRVRAPDDTWRWLNVRGRPRRLADGSTLWDAVALDITARKHGDEMLRERERQLLDLGGEFRRSEERYRRLFERNFVGIYRTRPDGVVVECNDAFARILGYRTAAEMQGRSVIEHYASPADRDAIVERIAAGEDVLDAEVTGRRRDGSLVSLAISVRRVVGAGEEAMHEGVLVDLTDRKRAQEASALRSVAALANAAAHEINNPLTVILGAFQLMELGADVAKHTARARAAAERIRDVVSHMQRITRLEPAAPPSGDVPSMLDIRRSAGPGADAVR